MGQSWGRSGCRPDTSGGSSATLACTKTGRSGGSSATSGCTRASTERSSEGLGRSPVPERSSETSARTQARSGCSLARSGCSAQNRSALHRSATSGGTPRHASRSSGTTGGSRGRRSRSPRLRVRSASYAQGSDQRGGAQGSSQTWKRMRACYGLPCHACMECSQTQW